MFWRNMLLFNSHVDVTVTFLLLLFLSLFGIGSSSAAPFYIDTYCPKNASYNSNVTFETNLKVLLATLVSNVSMSGFYYTFMGLGTTSVANGQFLCRGDASAATCQDCIATAAKEITRLCPNKTESIIWYDECTLYFTNHYFSRTGIEPRAMLSDDRNISASDLDSFNRTLFSLLNDLAEEAANSQSAKKFATGQSRFDGSSPQRTVYALAECAPTETSTQCEECLKNAISTLPSCCGGKQGARALLAHCDVRYELFLFYNTSGTSDPYKSKQLSWSERYKIIEGITQGISYLHEHSRLKVIHRDLKPSNVLLDSNMNPKISDFGMARIVAIDQYQGRTNRIVGTYGYMSPEYAMHGQFSEKSDVFSFGVIVLEIISAKRNSRSAFPDHDDLLSYAWEQWMDEAPLNIFDQSIKAEFCDHSEVVKCIQIGLLCVQEKPDDRPKMAQVISYLNSSITELPLPKKPINSRQSGIVQKIAVGESSSGSTPSINEMSVY
uniref:Cysteine-rich receptor-like protein kinase n=1 Tax=Glycine max TaxID=3847 RepID=A0A0R0EMH6_SOYBN